MTSSPYFLFAHGAGAPSSHPWMQRWRVLLSEVGTVRTFDYQYMAKGRRPDPLPKLIDEHRAALLAMPDPSSTVLIGKSMGGRIGCHLALETHVAAVVCMGYPLCAAGDRTKLRDKVLLASTVPILFVQGTRDTLCPLDLLAETRAKMQAHNELYVVDAGDHSLLVTKSALKNAGETQVAVDRRILETIRRFVMQRVRAP